VTYIILTGILTQPAVSRPTQGQGQGMQCQSQQCNKRFT